MGCDIHLCVERKNAKGEWVCQPEHTYDHRNYDVFSILADVRNDEGFKPVVPPRGVPKHASEHYKSLVKSWRGDGHSHSWLTLAELLAYDWTQVVTQHGIVSSGEYVAWKASGRKRPDCYSGGVGGPGVMIVTNWEMDTLLAKGVVVVTEDAGPWFFAEAAKDGNSYYTNVEWRITCLECAEAFMPFLEQLKTLGKPEDVRIVFFFDN